MHIQEPTPLLESIVPPQLAEDFDTGRIELVFDRGANIRKIAVALDSMDCVLKQEARLGSFICGSP